MGLRDFIKKLKTYFNKAYDNDDKEKKEDDKIEVKREKLKTYSTIFKRVEDMKLGPAIVVKGIYLSDELEEKEGWGIFLDALIECDFFLNEPKVVCVYELIDNVLNQHASVWEFSEDTIINPEIYEIWKENFFDKPEDFFKNCRGYYLSGR